MRQLRELLAEEDCDFSITQERLSEITGIPAFTIKKIEAGQRKLSGDAVLEIIANTTADWDQQKGCWIHFNSNPPESFKRKHYDEFKKRSMQRPVKAEKLVKDLLKKMDELFKMVGDSRWLTLYLRFRFFVKECRNDLQADQLEEIRLKSAKSFPGKAEGEHFEHHYQEELANNGLQEIGWSLRNLQ